MAVMIGDGNAKLECGIWQIVSITVADLLYYRGRKIRGSHYIHKYTRSDQKPIPLHKNH